MKRFIPFILVIALFVCCMVVPASAEPFEFEFDPWRDGQYNEEYIFKTNLIYDDSYQTVIREKIESFRMFCQTQRDGATSDQNRQYIYSKETGSDPLLNQFVATVTSDDEAAQVLISSDPMYFPYSVLNLTDPYFYSPDVASSIYFRVVNSSGTYSVKASCQLVVHYADDTNQRFTINNTYNVDNPLVPQVYSSVKFAYRPTTESSIVKNFIFEPGAVWYRVIWTLQYNGSVGDQIIVWNPLMTSNLYWDYDDVYKADRDGNILDAFGEMGEAIDGPYSPPNLSTGSVVETEKNITNAVAGYLTDANDLFTTGTETLQLYGTSFKAFSTMFNAATTRPLVVDGEVVEGQRVKNEFGLLLDVSLALGLLVVILGVVVHATSVTQAHERFKLAEAHRDMRAAQPKEHIHYHFRR